jgi:hypothetical protein
MTSANNKLVSALPGIGGGIFAVVIGSIIFLFSFASFGRQGAVAPSPAAGGMLYILMGLAGFIGSALIAGRRGVKALMALGGVSAASGLALSVFFKEWSAFALIIILAIAVCAAVYALSGASLLFFLGIIGFLIGQGSMIFILCGWKTWAIQGVLFIFCAAITAFPGAVRDKLPMHSWELKKSNSHAIYAVLCLLALTALILLLIHVPDESAAEAIYSSEAKAAQGLARYDIAVEAYDRLIEVDRSYAFAWNGKGDALLALGRKGEAQDCYNRAEEILQSAESKNPFFGSNATGQQPLSDCNCGAGGAKPPEEKPSNEKLPQENEGCKNCSAGSAIRASIISPGDIQTFPRGEAVNFTGLASCGRPPYEYQWASSINGIIGDAESLQRDDLSYGMHTITLTITDAASDTARASIDIGIAEPSVCGNVTPRPKYYPIDTPCDSIWPNASANCTKFEVCHPELDYIVEDAVNCCDGSPIPGAACSYACANSNGSKKRCRGLYIIKAFGPDADYMKGYALFKSCCSGYPECTRTCGLSLAGTCAFSDGANGNVKNLSCNSSVSGPDAWRSDTNMSKNSGSMGLIPTHATVNILQTGVCEDYSAAVTTLLRKAGYSKTEALTAVTGSYRLPLLGEHPGHGYGIVLLPGDTKYHFVDTTGNGEGINLGHVPGYFWFMGCFMGMPVRIKVFDWWVEYCNMTGKYAYNDAGYFMSPRSSCMMGCQN